MIDLMLNKLSVLWMLIFGFAILLLSCNTVDEKKFTLLSPSQTGVDFRNNVVSTPDFNIINYMYFYDGAGVAAGDLNNNGLPDLFFVGNEVPNKLYKNLGDFEFEDMSESAGIEGEPNSWSTGVTMADVNRNGFLDIYVSRVNYLNRSGHNQLFINNGDMTFTESAAEYRLDFEGYSTQAVFFDYNNSGRLDLFLLNHSFHSERTYGRPEVLRNIIDPKAGDRLFRNDGEYFTDVTEEAGIYSSALGYGLGVAVSDINKNGWPDIYVGNDFHEDDYLYINNGDGTFTESLYDMIGHTSYSSMGNDIADLTNDGYVDIYSLDMMAEDHETYMQSGGPDFVFIYETKKSTGFGRKNNRNTLQINRGLSPDGTIKFSDYAFTLGVAKTDWSWAGLIADFTNNGFKDIFVTNGIVHRPNNLDYQRIIGNIRDRSTEGSITTEEFESIEKMPSTHVPNYAYQNNGALSLNDVTSEWGLDRRSFGSGAVYVDLNNNGMLDLVVSNINEPASIYRNNAVADSSSNFIKVKLSGEAGNSTGIGSKVILFKDDIQFYYEQMPTRGFQSSVPHQLHIGLGENTEVDSMLIIWPDRSFEKIMEPVINQLVNIDKSNASGEFDYSLLHRTYEHARLENVSQQYSIDFEHKENTYDDFSQEPLLPFKLSAEGPALAVGDWSGNGLDDLFLGGAHNQASVLMEQVRPGIFEQKHQDLLERASGAEDVDALFFDATGNGALDLYVVSGGGQMLGEDETLSDRLYLNDGKGLFEHAAEHLPEYKMNGSVVRAADFDGDGSIDLFVGGRSIPWAYGKSPQHQLLKNNGEGVFEDVTGELIPELVELGMVTDAVWADITGNGKKDLVIAGEWMPITIFENQGSEFFNVTESYGLQNTSGLWQSLLVTDLSGDGNMDILAGNFGTNTRLQPTAENPYTLYINDFDESGYTSGIVARNVNGKMVPFEQLDELMLELPNLSRQVRSYSDFATKSLQELLGNDMIIEAKQRNLHELRTIAFINDGNGQFSRTILPADLQAFPVKAIYQLNHENESVNVDLLLAGNHYPVKPSYGGRQDAGYGAMVSYNRSDGTFTSQKIQNSGFFVEGQVRSIESVSLGDGYELIITARNNQTLKLFKLQNDSFRK